LEPEEKPPMDATLTDMIRLLELETQNARQRTALELIRRVALKGDEGALEVIAGIAAVTGFDVL
jgi:hypothetical protein